MPDNTNMQDPKWPMPKFSFEVNLGPELQNIAFQEVNGLSTDSQIIEYHINDTPFFAGEKMPGIAKYGNVTLKKGIFTGNTYFWQWYRQITMNTIHRTNALIKLLDETGNIAMQWTLHNAWSTKITGTDLKSDGDEVAIETIEIAYEQITIS